MKESEAQRKAKKKYSDKLVKINIKIDPETEKNLYDLWINFIDKNNLEDKPKEAFKKLLESLTDHI